MTWTYQGRSWLCRTHFAGFKAEAVLEFLCSEKCQRWHRLCRMDGCRETVKFCIAHKSHTTESTSEPGEQSWGLRPSLGSCKASNQAHSLPWCQNKKSFRAWGTHSTWSLSTFIAGWALVFFMCLAYVSAVPFHSYIYFSPYNPWSRLGGHWDWEKPTKTSVFLPWSGRGQETRVLQAQSSAKSNLVDELCGMMNLVLNETLKFCEHALFPSR